MKNKDFYKRKKAYFEGWYFKNQFEDNIISFIPGININQMEKNTPLFKL